MNVLCLPDNLFGLMTSVIGPVSPPSCDLAPLHSPAYARRPAGSHSIFKFSPKTQNEQRWPRPTAHRSWLPGYRSSSTRYHARRSPSMPRRPCGASTTAASTFPSRKRGGTHVSHIWQLQTRHDRLNWHLRMVKSRGLLRPVNRV